MIFLKLLLVGSQIFTTKLAVNGFKDSKKYRATANNALAQNLSSTMSNSSATNDDNLTVVYFKNLNKNVPFNNFGTCSYVAMEMLLSYYDTFYNDGFIDEKFEQKEIIDDANGKTVINTESPGIKIDNYGELFSNFPSDFNQYIHDNANEYFEYYLLDCFGYNPSFEGVSLYDQIQNLRYYIAYRSNVALNEVQIETCNNSDSTIQNDFISENVEKGIPVVINCNHPMMGRHTMIAYDMDNSNNTFFVHTGFKDFNGQAISHVSLKYFEDLIIESSYVIKYTSNIFSSDNYRNSNNEPIQQTDLFNITGLKKDGSTLYRDIAPSFSWNNNIKKVLIGNLYNNESYLNIKVLSNRSVVIVDKNIDIEAKHFKLNDKEWKSVLLTQTTLSSTFSVEITAYFDQYTIASQSNVSTRLAFVIPSTGSSNNVHLIKPAQWGYSSIEESIYTVEDEPETKLVRGVTDNGYEFLTKRFNAARNKKTNTIDLVPSKNNMRQAYIEYTFTTTITRMDFQIAYVQSSRSRLNNPKSMTNTIKVQYGKVEFDEYYQSYDIVYHDATTGYTNNKLPIDTTAKTLSVIFEQPVNRVRFYTNIPGTKNNLDYISIGNIFIYDSDNTKTQKYMKPSGYEITYDANFWKATKFNGNCYAYAFNMTEFNCDKPSPINSYGISQECVEGYFTDPKVIPACVALEANKYGFYFKELENKNDPIAPGHYRVALALAESGNEYHWYRQNLDGTWSHKSGIDFVNIGDFDGNIIIDPENITGTISLLLGHCDNFNYNVFVGYFEVSQIEVPYQVDESKFNYSDVWFLDDEGYITLRTSENEPIIRLE